MKIQLKQTGFTLIELLIIISIMGIVIAIATPNISSVISQYRARTEARELVIQFKKAKLEAVKRNRDVCLDFINVGAANGQYQIFVNVDRDTNSPHTYDPGAGDVLLVNRQLRPSVRILSSTFTNSQAGYNFRGLPLQLANQTVEIGTGLAGSLSYTLTVSLTGSVRIQ